MHHNKFNTWWAGFSASSQDRFRISIDPSTVTLTQSTLDLLNAGEFALCIQVASPIEGTVTIDSLTFNLGV